MGGELVRVSAWSAAGAPTASLSPLLKYSPGRISTHLLRDLSLVVLFAVGTLVLANYLLLSEVRRELALNQIDQAKLLVR